MAHAAPPRVSAPHDLTRPTRVAVRSKYVPDAQQSTVNNLFRFPLNMLVATGTMLSEYVDLYIVFAICAGAHLIATLTQVRPPPPSPSLPLPSLPLGAHGSSYLCSPTP